MNTEWKIFGRKSKFAFEYRFENDPDATSGSPDHPIQWGPPPLIPGLDEIGTWGSFRFWVRGRNICQFSYNDVTVHEVTWYLDSLIRWLRLGLTGESAFSSDSAWIINDLIRFYRDTSVSDIEYDELHSSVYNWAEKTSLSSNSIGGTYPPLFIYTNGNNLELRILSGAFYHSPEFGVKFVHDDDAVFKFSRKEDVLVPLTRAVLDMETTLIKHYKPKENVVVF